MGRPPSHPELLDFLAAFLVEHDWQLKPLHRMIVTSATYRQSAFHPQMEAAQAIDPENHLLWRANIRRLDAEQVRDAMLVASGELDRRLGGPTVLGKTPRRSLYVRRMRNSPDALLSAFDTVSGFHSVAVRDRTTTPTQTLLMLNGDQVLARADAIARRIENETQGDVEQVVLAYRLVLGKRPDPEQRERVIQFLQAQYRRARSSLPTDQQAAHAALVDLCHVLINGNAFLYVE